MNTNTNSMAEQSHTAQYLHRLFNDDFDRFCEVLEISPGRARRKWEQSTTKSRRDDITMQDLSIMAEALRMDWPDIMLGLTEAHKKDSL